jgi:hypothetical protein
MRIGVGVVEMQLHIFLTYAVKGGGWSCLQPGHVTCVERALSTHWIGGWVDSRYDLAMVMGRKVTLIFLKIEKYYLSGYNAV